MTRILDVRMVASAGKLESLPEETLPEVAFAGRSNVGKSSLLNALCNRSGLFKVSQTPGRTRTIVHAEARLEGELMIYLVDLPGYGYAKVARGAKQAWSVLLETYLRQRQSLRACVVLVDVRRGLEEEEEQLLDFMGRRGKPSIVVATKIDKVPKNQRKPLLENLRGTTRRKVIGTSATTGEGLEELVRIIATVCATQVPAQDPSEPPV